MTDTIQYTTTKEVTVEEFLEQERKLKTRLEEQKMSIKELKELDRDWQFTKRIIQDLLNKDLIKATSDRKFEAT